MESLSLEMNSQVKKIENGPFHGGNTSIDELKKLIETFKNSGDKEKEVYIELLKDSIESIERFMEDEEDASNIKMQSFYMPESEFIKIKAIIYEMLDISEDYHFESDPVDFEMNYSSCPHYLIAGLLWADLTLDVHKIRDENYVTFYIPEILCRINMQDVLFFTMIMWDIMFTKNNKVLNAGDELLKVVKEVAENMKIAYDKNHGPFTEGEI